MPSDIVIQGLSYEMRIRKLFPNAYVQEENWKYGGPIWFRYAIFTGDNAYCDNTLLGLGQEVDKAWLDAFYGFKFIKVHLGLEKRKELRATADSIIKEDTERNPSTHKGTENIKEYNRKRLNFKEMLGYSEEIDIEYSITFSSVKSVKVEKELNVPKNGSTVRCESFIKNPKDKRKWIQCSRSSSVKVSIDYPKFVKGETILFLCEECYTKSTNKNAGIITVLEQL